MRRISSWGFGSGAGGEEGASHRPFPDEADGGSLRRVVGSEQFVGGRGTLGRVLGEGPGDDPPVGLRQLRQVGLRRQVLHQDFLRRLPLERDLPGEHLVQDHAHGVDVDRLLIPAGRDLGGHVVARPDAFGVAGLLALGDRLGEAVVADLDDPLVQEQVGGLQVAVDGAVVVQVRHPLDQPLEPGPHLGQGQAVGVLGQDLGEARPGDVLHHDEGIPGVVGLDVVDGDQIRALEVHALHDPAALDLEVARDELQRHLLAGVGGRVIDLAEAAAADGALDRVAVQGAVARAEAEAVVPPRRRLRPGGSAGVRRGPGNMGDRLGIRLARSVLGRRVHRDGHSVGDSSRGIHRYCKRFDRAGR